MSGRVERRDSEEKEMLFTFNFTDLSLRFGSFIFPEAPPRPRFPYRKNQRSRE